VFNDGSLKRSGWLYDPEVSLSGMNVRQVCVAGQMVKHGVQVEFRARFSLIVKWRENGVVAADETMKVLLLVRSACLTITGTLKMTSRKAIDINLTVL
jgi:hypothetical protein